jgi:transglutaminase-like putative cysteine protease
MGVETRRITQIRGSRIEVRDSSILDPRSSYNQAVGAFDRWRALSPDAQRLTMRSAMVIGAAVVAIRVFDVERTLRIASRPVHGRAKTVIGEVVTAVDRAGRYVPGGTCLPKSVALAWMLRGMGVDATVRIGVRTDEGFEAHAWVEAEGVALTAPTGAADRFAAIL